VWTGVIIAVLLIGRPARLETIRWWRSSPVVASLGLTTIQSEQIDRLYQERLLGRRRCTERLAAASNRVDRLIRDGAYYEDTLREQVQAVMNAAADERALTQAFNDEVAALLSPQQRRQLARLRPGHIIE
jgi:hypothetical protein